MDLVGSFPGLVISIALIACKDWDISVMMQSMLGLGSHGVVGLAVWFFFMLKRPMPACFMHSTLEWQVELGCIKHLKS